jgi:hypothetical protein
MSVSTDGQLCFGVLFEEGYSFPWDDDEYEGDIEKYWKSLKGFVNPVECPYDENHNYKPGISGFNDPKVGAYLDAVINWGKNNPVPIELVNYCSGGYPLYIIATKNISASRGSPEVIDPDFLNINYEEEKKKIFDFLSACDIETTEEPKWYLSSYWSN